MTTTDNEVLHNYLKTKIDMDGVIPDYMLPVFALQELCKQDKELAALREAGEKMAEQWRNMKSYQSSIVNHDDPDATVLITWQNLFDEQDAAALEAWETANK